MVQCRRFCIMKFIRYITDIELNRYKVSSVKLPRNVANRLRKNSKKKSSYVLKLTRLNG